MPIEASEHFAWFMKTAGNNQAAAATTGKAKDASPYTLREFYSFTKDTLTRLLGHDGMLFFVLCTLFWNSYRAYTQTKRRVVLALVSAVLVYDSTVMRVVLHWSH